MANAKQTEKKTFFAVGITTKQNGVKPGLYAGVDKKTQAHVFLTEGTTDADRQLTVDLLEEKQAAEKKLEALQTILFNFDLSVQPVELEVEVKPDASN